MGWKLRKRLCPCAKNLHLDVVAEGVETADQVRELKKLNCKYAQGFYFSKPLSPDEAEALMTEHVAW